TVVTLRAARDAAFAAGDAVAIGKDGGLDLARRGTDVAGVALTGAGRDATAVKIAIAGVVSCTVEDGVTAGALLGIGAVPGKLAAVEDGASVARALTAADAEQRALCLLKAR
ncbi:hypothetical protein K2Z84_20765, partial [Candidatus Binatia bacterium]|nr:hypothetical protein [Candidatus Binatia bacterium]